MTPLTTIGVAWELTCAAGRAASPGGGRIALEAKRPGWSEIRDVLELICVSGE